MFISFSAFSQDDKKESNNKLWQLIDTLFIDHDLKKYSARIFTNYKVKQFKIENGDDRLNYIPNNRVGIGFGVANSKAVIDIAFNIKNGKEHDSPGI